MARTNFEDSAIVEGLISGIVARLRVNEFAAAGMLTFMWKDTQRAMFVSGSREALRQAIGRRWPNDEDADRFIDAAIVCGAIAKHMGEHLLGGEELEVVGNGKHVERLLKLRLSARLGGAARAKAKANAKHTLKDTKAKSEQNPAKTEPKPSAPYSLLPTVEDQDQLASLVDAPQAEAVKSSPEVWQIRDAFSAGYAELYNGAPYEWDHARDGKQAKALIKKAPGGIDQLLVEIDAYFGWRDPEVIAKGHSFSDGFTSFVATRKRLQADMAAPERHRAAAVIRQERYQEGKDAYVKKLGQ